MSELRDITAPFTARPKFIKNVEKFRSKCMGYPMVKDCAVNMTSFLGRRTGDNTFAIVAKGEVEISGPMSSKIKLLAEGNAHLDSTTKIITVEDVRVLNDFGGIMGGVLGWAGFKKGGTIEMSDKDVGWLVKALS